MRVISGTAKRKPISVPDEVARPSTDRLREALFSILQQLLADARVLDLFAGSGALSLESLSRGAKTATCVDAHRQATACIKKNIKSTGLAGAQVVQADVFRFLSTARHSEYELIFADPPYYKKSGDRNFANELLADENLPPLLADGGYFILEVPTQRPPLEPLAGWELVDERSYGACTILFFRWQSELAE